eukprot:4936846-Alexandrium_andersonii.AAC.1
MASALARHHAAALDLQAAAFEAAARQLRSTSAAVEREAQPAPEEAEEEEDEEEARTTYPSFGRNI